MGEGCELAETTIFLLDPDSAARTGPHLVVAKFVLQPFSGARKRFERIVLLGENFLADNGIGLVQQSVGGTLTGYLSVPIP